MQPAPSGEAVSVQLRPGAQLGWEKLAGHCGTPATHSSKDRLNFCQSRSEGNHCLPPNKVQFLPATSGAGC